MADHGFLQPNPALFDLEARLAGRTGPRLAHELGAGAECTKCGEACPGFQLHFWRKVCSNCRCGKGEHNVKEQLDHGVSFVGKIFDRPLRTRAEEHKFIYGDMVEPGQDSCKPAAHPQKEVILDWVPPGLSNTLASKYMRALPQDHLPIQGSEGAIRRKRQLERQFPLHDVEPESCHELTQVEKDTMSSYVDNVKKNVAGQGIVQELDLRGLHPGGLVSGRATPSPPPCLPPPPMELLSGAASDYTGLSYASPAHAGKPLPGSTGSSLAATPSPPPLLPTLSHSKVWHCAGCGSEMAPGSVAIFAERAGTDRCWHPSCFACSSCGDLLEDLLYFFNGGKLYCGRDFAQLMNIPRCAACDELIFATEYTGAEDRVWHLKHFCCYLCDSPLAGHKYIPVDGQPHCLACWQREYGKMCSTCKKVIDPQAQRVSLGSDNWHATHQCFRCGVCSKSLLGGKMSRRSGTLLCSSKCGQELARRHLEPTKELPPHSARAPASSQQLPLPSGRGVMSSEHAGRVGPGMLGEYTGMAGSGVGRAGMTSAYSSSSSSLSSGGRSNSRLSEAGSSGQANLSMSSDCVEPLRASLQGLSVTNSGAHSTGYKGLGSQGGRGHLQDTQGLSRLPSHQPGALTVKPSHISYPTPASNSKYHNTGLTSSDNSQSYHQRNGSFSTIV